MQQANFRTLRADFLNPLASMVPLLHLQSEVYRPPEKIPPGLEGYQPRWEIVDMTLGAQKTLQVRVDIMSDFYLLAVGTFTTVNTVGSFRAQFYDVLKKRKLTDRGLQMANLGGLGRTTAFMFLRDAYHFDQPRSQLLVMIQNLEPVANPLQIALFGMSAPFLGRLSNEL